MLRIVWTLLLILQAGFLAGSPAFAQERASTAEDLLRRCGAWEQLGSLEPQIRAGFFQALSARRKPSEAETERLAKAIKFAYEPARMRATAARIVANGLAEEHVIELKRWYASPAGLAITTLEEQASADSADPGEVMSKAAAVLESSTARRLELLDDLARDSRAAESAVELALSTALAVQRGMMAAVPDAPAMTAAELKAALARQRPMLLDAYQKLTRAAFAVTYQPLSDAELERYAAFMRSPAGQHFNELVVRALDAALSEATEELGRNLPGTQDRANS